MTPIEIKRTQGNYVNNDAGAFVNQDKPVMVRSIKPQGSAYADMRELPEVKEISDTQHRINKVQIIEFELEDQLEQATQRRDEDSVIFIQARLDEYANELLYLRSIS